MAKDILELVSENESLARRRMRRGVIISPAAIGDCILMLPLAKFMKKSLRLGGVNFIGHTEYINYFVGRTCIDGICSLETTEFHRLFTNHKDFTVDDNDSLVSAFAGYEWIVSFLGAGDENFETNLNFTVNCSRSAEVTMLPLESAVEFGGHISEFYINKLVENACPARQPGLFDIQQTLIKPSSADFDCGRRILRSEAIRDDGKTVIIQPGSGSKDKCWHLENFLHLTERLEQMKIQPLFILGPAEVERFDGPEMKTISSAARYLCQPELTDVMRIIACSDCFIGNDSGITHMAASMAVPVVAVFGPTNPALYRPIGPEVRVFKVTEPDFSRPSDQAVGKAAELVLATLNI